MQTWSCGYQDHSQSGILNETCKQSEIPTNIFIEKAAHISNIPIVNQVNRKTDIHQVPEYKN